MTDTITNTDTTGEGTVNNAVEVKGGDNLWV